MSRSAIRSSRALAVALAGVTLAAALHSTPVEAGYYGGRGPGIGAGIGIGLGVGAAIGVIGAAAAAHAAHAYHHPYPHRPVFVEAVEPVQRVYRSVSRIPPETPIRVERGGGAPTVALPAGEDRFVDDEILVETLTTIGETQIDALAARQNLVRLSTEVFQFSRIRLHRLKIMDGRPVREVMRTLGRERGVLRTQPNFLFTLADMARFAQAPGAPAIPVPPMIGGGARPPMAPMMAPATPMAPSVAPQFAPQMPAATAIPRPPLITPGARPAMPASFTAASMPAQAPQPAQATQADLPQYALEKLNLAFAHQIARGDNVLVAVIDSGIDLTHPELAGTVAAVHDVAEGGWQPHAHGTAMAGAIAARARLVGAAPQARLVVIRAFSGDEARSSGASGTTIHVLRAIEIARESGARVLNMSFAGPADALTARALANAREAGLVLVAASGNGGPNARPAFPAADPNVIAVTATDAEDRLFPQAQRGRHVAVAAPGVDILVPAPGGGYDMTSGTSVAAAKVSGVAALALGLQPRLDAEGARRLLTATARDLGPRGRDDQFGAGLVDAAGVVQAAGAQMASARPR